MVDVTDKKPSVRVAVAGGRVVMKPETLKMIGDQAVKKGNVLETARIAGIMAAKRTSELIPMCHPLNLTHVQVDFKPDESQNRIDIEASARIIDQTGVEMEALTAVSAAALTIYDMCKSDDREMTITDIRLLEKSGGKSGTYRRNENV
jgi:cyclic pyranopterin phosphate synthase